MSSEKRLMPSGEKMQNETDLLGTVTMNRGLSVALKICFVVPFFGTFFYCAVVTLHTFTSHRQFWDSSRYVLFVCMLLNDTLQLLLSMLLFFFVMAELRLPIAFCFPLLFLSTATFQNTPLILAAMSLERYIAIFYPLQQPTAWRADRIWVIILVLWMVSCVIPTVDFSLGRVWSAADAFSLLVTCKTSLLNISPAQTLFKVSANGLFFAVVAAAIIFTYVRILLEARRMRRERASAIKALHTVLLHGLQLLLCMMAFTHPVTENLIVLHVGWLREHMTFVNFFCFILLPRFLSPLIYGLRDEALRQHVKGAFFCCRPTTVGP